MATEREQQATFQSALAKKIKEFIRREYAEIEGKVTKRDAKCRTKRARYFEQKAHSTCVHPGPYMSTTSHRCIRTARGAQRVMENMQVVTV